VADKGILVQVRIYPWYSELLAPGQHTTLALEQQLPPDSSLRTLMTKLAGRFVKFREIIYEPQHDLLQAGVVATHNGRLVPMPAALDLPLSNGDTVAIVPAYAGG
jgi:molybdopterin converting factor small subunit